MKYEITFIALFALALLLSCATAPRSDGISNNEALGIIALDREFRK